MSDTDWVTRAACRGTDPNPYFPERGVGIPEHIKQRCADCPVRQECADFAIADRSITGYWGGLSDKQRRTERSRRRKTGELVHIHANRKPIAHGTNAGYKAHRSRGEDPCDDCQVAHNQYQKQRRAIAS